MAKTTVNEKPEKPYSDFPLSPLTNGQWGKKINGKHYYFGVWADPDAALLEYLNEKDDLFAGRRPESRSNLAITVYEACNHFLTAKKSLVGTNERSQRTYRDYVHTCEKLCGILGKTRSVESLTAKDFAELRSKLSEGVGLVRLGNMIQHIRSMFRFAAENDLVAKAVKFGTEFKKPAKKAVRREQRGRPAKRFSATNLRTIIEGAPVPMKAMILLGINCGFGQTDCSMMPIDAADLKNRNCAFPRPKTEVPRSCPLWPETIEAIQATIKDRAKPATENLKDRLFLTSVGTEYVRFSEKGTSLNGISRQFDRLLEKLDLKTDGHTFYALRHTFETIGGDSGDQVAVNFIMGHTPDDDDMAAIYRKEVFRRRLKKVVDHVRKWLLTKK